MSFAAPLHACCARPCRSSLATSPPRAGRGHCLCAGGRLAHDARQEPGGAGQQRPGRAQRGGAGALRCRCATAAVRSAVQRDAAQARPSARARMCPCVCATACCTASGCWVQVTVHFSLRSSAGGPPGYLAVRRRVTRSGRSDLSMRRAAASQAAAQEGAGSEERAAGAAAEGSGGAGFSPESYGGRWQAVTPDALQRELSQYGIHTQAIERRVPGRWRPVHAAGGAWEQRSAAHAAPAVAAHGVPACARHMRWQRFSFYRDHPHLLTASPKRMLPMLRAPTLGHTPLPPARLPAG